MKKIVLALVAVGALLVMGCEQPTSAPSTGTTGNPKEVEGTWKGTVTNLAASLNLAQAKEGSWTRTTVTNPQPSRTDTSSTNGITTTTKYYFNGQQTTEKIDVVINADGSYTKTTTTTEVWTARAAETVPANTATASVVVRVDDFSANASGGTAYAAGASVPANEAGTKTTVVTITSTVALRYESSTPASTTYRETVVTKTDITQSGARFPATGFTASTTNTVTTVTDNITSANLGFNGLPLFDTTYTQTVKPNNRDELSKKEDWDLVINADGTYKWTKIITETRAAKAATATTPAVTVGTRTATIVEDGWATVTILPAFNNGREEKQLFLSAVKTATTKIGTAGLISVEYPVAAVTNETGNIQATNGFKYFITSGSGASRISLWNLSTSTSPPPSPYYVVLQKAK